MGFSERFQGANRIDAGRLSPYWGEHAARYHFALERVAGKKVLDIACGTGYGIGLLRKSARFVCGVDIDREAALQARSECGDRSAVVLGDGLRLPFHDKCFDVVTSFETIEHLHDRLGFLRELERVLAPGGGSPNFDAKRSLHKAESREAIESLPRLRIHARRIPRTVKQSVLD